MNKKIPINLFFILLFAFTAFQTNANIPQTIVFKSNSELIIQTDTLDGMKEISPIISTQANEMMSKQVEKWSTERFITLDPPAIIDTASILYLLDGKKIEDLSQINDLVQVKSIQILKEGDVPKRYKKKGINGVVKISTKK